MKSIDLDALETLTNTVERHGITYPVRPITPRVSSMIDAAGSAVGDAKVAAYYNAVARLVPSMPREEVDELSVPQVLAIIELSSEAVGIVSEAAADPNVGGSTASPAPSSDTPLATS